MLNGKVALVTGANSGIGRVTAVELALQGAHVFLACRSRVATEVVIDEIRERSHGRAKAEFLPLDLADLISIRACAHQFLARNMPLHILINNAGIACQKGLTSSGFELAFGVCHVGHFLLTSLLIDKLKESAPSRVVVVASGAHMVARGIDFDAAVKPTRTLTAFKEYGVAKLANILFAAELGRRLHGTGVKAYSLHPGAVATAIWRFVGPLEPLFRLFMITPDQGARTTLFCATSSEVNDQTGLYYEKCKVKKPSSVARDAKLASRLWEQTEFWLSGQ